MAKQVQLLTEASVKKAKSRPERREIRDGGGLYLVVHPSGAKSWAVRYRSEGRPRKYTIPGSYPGVGLKAARKAARAVLEAVAHGGDPASEKREARRTAADTRTEYRHVAAEFLDRYLTKKKQRPRKRTLEELARLLGFYGTGGAWKVRKDSLAEKWGRRRIATITKGDVINQLDAMVERGIKANANRTRAALHLFFGWCARRDLIPANPVSGVDHPVAEKPRDRFLNDDELRLFWKATEGDKLFGGLFRLLALTGQRRDEVRSMNWGELDLEERLWTLPASRAKNNREHIIPLADAAVEILRAQPRIKGKAGLVFTTNGQTPVSGISRAKKRLDEKMLELARERDPDTTIPPWVTHDLRRTVASGMAKLGIALPAIEKVLNHSSGSFGGIVGVYQHHDFADEKRTALNAWADHIARILNGSPTKVVKFQRRAG